MSIQILRALGSSSGAFTWTQAHRSGISSGRLRAWVADGSVRKLAYDLYSVAEEPADLRERHRELLNAATHRYGDRVMACEHSALIAHGLPTYDADLGRVSLLWRNGASNRTNGQIHIRRSRFDFPNVTVGSIGTVTEPAAFLQVAAGLGIGAAVVAGDAMLHRGSTDGDALRDMCERFATYPGRGIALEAHGLLDARSESPGESVLRILLLRAGFDLISQHEIFEDGVLLARADFLIEGSRVLVEFDGKVKYRSAEDLWREKQREDRLRRLGYIVERVIWSDFSTPKALIARLLASVELYGDPVVAG